MKDISFQIFIPKRGFHFTTDMFVWSGIGLPLIFILIVENYFHEFYIRNNVDKIVSPIITGFLILGFVMYFVSFSRKRKLKGYLDGTLQLKVNEVVVNGESYLLKDIRSLEFYADDFQDRFEMLTGSANPRCSRGIDNWCIINLISGEKIKVNFLQEFEDQLKQNEELVVHYFKADKIPIMNILSILRLNSYSEIRAFKEKHNR